VLSVVHLFTDNHERSLHFGQLYFEASQGWVHALIYILAPLIHLGRSDEVANFVDRSIKNHPDHRAEIDRILADHSESLCKPAELVHVSERAV